MGVGAVNVRGSTVELRGDPRHGNQCDGGSDEINLQFAQPCEILQIRTVRAVWTAIA